ncbi:hypothetical protein D9M68_613090 [compost metagenome]
MPPPTTSAARISARPVPGADGSAPPDSSSLFSLKISATVVSAATNMPAMPKVLPRRAVVGCDSPLSAWIKQTDAPR